MALSKALLFAIAGVAALALGVIILAVVAAPDLPANHRLSLCGGALLLAIAVGVMLSEIDLHG